MQSHHTTRGELLSISTKILRRVGTSAEDAASIADSLVQAEEAGHPSHGVVRLMEYVKMVEQRLVIPTHHPRIESDRGAVTVMDAQWGWGQIACKEAIKIVAEKASSHGIATIVIKSCNHVGRLSDYVESLAQQDLIGIMWCNAGSAVAPHGGKTRVFGTNPFAAGIPADSGEIVLDFATAGTAEGKLQIARANGAQVQKGLILTKDGQETVEPEDFYAGGALLPFGGHKGYCLSFFVELLGGALSGNHPSMNSSYSHGNGVVIIAMDPEFFVGTEEFKSDVDEAAGVIKGSPAIDEKAPVLLPGEVENEKRVRSSSGVEISSAVWQSLQDLDSRLDRPGGVSA